MDGVPTEVVEFLRAARVGRLATCGPDGAPHVVPVCYALVGGELFVPIDRKPKRVGWRELRRVRNLAADPRSSLLVDRWSERWEELCWVMVEGRAVLLEGGGRYEAALAALEVKYPQYRRMGLSSLGLPTIALEPDRVVW